MQATVFSHNGKLLPIHQAHVPLDDIAYSYGFGVYETIRVNDAVPFFVEQHLHRLMESATIIGLKHQFSIESVRKYLDDLIAANAIQTANAKLLLIGGKTDQSANLYIQLLSPYFPDRKMYKAGAHLITHENERVFPHAKTLNMLPSYIAYRQAKETGAYDALLVNKSGNVTEGTRTNVFGIRNNALITPPDDQMLLGVMRSIVLQVAKKQGIEVIIEDIPLAGLDQYEGLIVTSTSSKVMPVISVNAHAFSGIPSLVRTLMTHVSEFLESSRGIMEDAGSL